MLSAAYRHPSVLERAILAVGTAMIPLPCAAAQIGFDFSGILPLLFGILLLLVSIFLEWRSIYRTVTIEDQPLAHIERFHPRLITGREIVIAVLLSATLGVFLTQLYISIRAQVHIPDAPALTQYGLP